MEVSKMSGISKISGIVICLWSRIAIIFVKDRVFFVSGLVMFFVQEKCDTWYTYFCVRVVGTILTVSFLSPHALLHSAAGGGRIVSHITTCRPSVSRPSASRAIAKSV